MKNLFNSDHSEPIRIIKNRKTKRARINLFEDNDIPDPQEDFKILFEQSGSAIQRTTKPCRKKGDYDSNFNIPYNETKHQKFLTDNLHIGKTTPKHINDQLINLIKEYWCCFDPNGVKIPIRDYEVIIDTGKSTPVKTKNFRYGMHEAPIMQKAIDALLSNDQIEISVDGQ